MGCQVGCPGGLPGAVCTMPVLVRCLRSMVRLANVLGSLTEYDLASQVRFKVARPVTEPEAARITWLGSTQHANKVGELMPHHEIWVQQSGGGV